MTEPERKHRRKVLAISLTVSGVVLVGGTLALVLALTQTRTVLHDDRARSTSGDALMTRGALPPPPCSPCWWPPAAPASDGDHPRHHHRGRAHPRRRAEAPLEVADREASLDDTIYESDVNLCNPVLSTACYNIPVTGVLFPGKAHGSDSVRVRSTPSGRAAPSSPTPRSSPSPSTRACAWTSCSTPTASATSTCAERDQACGPLDTCIILVARADEQRSARSRRCRRGRPTCRCPPPDMTLVDLAGADSDARVARPLTRRSTWPAAAASLRHGRGVHRRQCCRLRLPRRALLLS